MKKIATSFLLVILSICTTAQNNDLCQTSNPVCASTSYSFDASTGGYAQPGPSYGCLLSQPNPSWFYFRIADPGDITITMSSFPEHDIDFICWGPYDDPHGHCAGGLTADKVVSCSYSNASHETCCVTGSETGEYYVLLITNFSNAACSVILNQTGGTGSTDCAILSATIQSNSPVCENDTLKLFASTVPDANYSWTGPASYFSNQQNPVIPNASIQMSGAYTCIITNPMVEDTVTLSVFVQSKPKAAFVADTAVAGTPTAFTDLSGIGSGNVAVWDWDFGDGQGHSVISNPVYTYTSPGIYIAQLTVTSDNGCSDAVQQAVNVNPRLSIQAVATPSKVCQGSMSQLSANTDGGSGMYSYHWTSIPPGFESFEPEPLTKVHEMTVFCVRVDDGDQYLYDTVIVDIFHAPVVEAGQDLDIICGTATTLNGMVTGGTAPFSYNWQPCDLLIDPLIEDPRTVPLMTNTEFELMVSDQNGCSGSDHVLVQLKPGTLSVSVYGIPQQPVCRGEHIDLTALATGGSQQYTYAWKDETDKIISSDQEVHLIAVGTTVLMLQVDDGTGTVVKNIEVLVYEGPSINPIPNGYQSDSPDSVRVCTYDQITIHAGGPGMIYRWFDGSSGPDLTLVTSGVGIDPQTIWLDVTDPVTGCVVSDTIVIVYDFSSCVGVDETRDNGLIRSYPNPTNGILSVDYINTGEPSRLTLTTITGQLVLDQVLPAVSPGVDRIQFDLHTLSKGIYLLKFIRGHQIYIEKIIVN